MGLSLHACGPLFASHYGTTCGGGRAVGCVVSMARICHNGRQPARRYYIFVRANRCIKTRVSVARLVDAERVINCLLCGTYPAPCLKLVLPGAIRIRAYPTIIFWMVFLQETLYTHTDNFWMVFYRKHSIPLSIALIGFPGHRHIPLKTVLLE